LPSEFESSVAYEAYLRDLVRSRAFRAKAEARTPQDAGQDRREESEFLELLKEYLWQPQSTQPTDERTD
jgi:hypothetical protein